ncbi:hypothetical protein BvCmsOUNP003_04793 [Escherichia coli]|uniref:hypothetical protein n=1 Tax=Escherichia coli TaxID=562 RepID=UPI00067FDE3C|nr:hypothetical protein [Escherichia coli]EKD3776358.1 hypothetical protein [Shigella flexneri]EJM7119888.1 hypothetical protein [Escherichia coli]EJO8438196.1 hypothetical protein [Escherichia coli]EKN0270482.1 hypothetical protein [Escherichia coli]
MMEIVKYKGKLEIIRNIIRDTMLGNLALAVLIFGIFSLRANNQGVIEELFSYVLMFGSVIVFVWLIMMVYIYFNELIKNVIIRWIFIVIWIVPADIVLIFSYIWDRL